MTRYLALWAVLLVVIVFLPVAGCGVGEELELEPLEGEVSELAENFVTYLVEGEFGQAYDYFSRDMRRVMSERELSVSWQQLLHMVGDYEGKIDQRTVKAEEFEVVIIKASFQNEPVDIRIEFNENNRVSDLLFDEVEE